MNDRVLFENGNLITMDQQLPLAHNVLVEGSTIRALNVEKESLNRDVEIYDLKGETVIPGLNDSHLHMVSYGISLDMVDLNDAESVKEVKQRVGEYIQSDGVEEGEWIFGRGWNEENFKGKKDLSKDDLDEISTKHPIVLTRTCGHLRVLNSRALQECDITPETKVEGGVIGTDEEGNLTGLIAEEAKELLYDNMPDYTVEDFKRFIQNAGEKFRESGLTTVQSDDLEASNEPREKVLKAFFELLEEDELPIKVNMQMQIKSPEEIAQFFAEHQERVLSDHLSFGPLKIVPDGSLGAKTAALNEPYLGSENNYGVLIYSKTELEAKIDAAYRHGVQVACHAIGDRTIETFLDIIEKMKDKYNRTGRPRIIHSQITNLDLIQRMKELNVVADAQPAFVGTDWKVAEDVLGRERCINTYAWKTMMDHGIVVSGGSDAPVETYDPFAGIDCAVNRQDSDSNPPGGWMPQEKVTVFEALKMYTVNSAYSCYQEDRIGRLAPHYQADFLVIDRNPFTIPEEDLDSIEVKTSVVNGNVKEYC